MTHRKYATALGTALALGLIGCSPTADDPASPGRNVPTDLGEGGAGGGGSEDATDPLDDFFSLAKVHTIEVTLDSQAIASLKQEPRTYTHGAVKIGDSSYADVGIRLKGGAGSFVPIDGDYPEISGDGNGNPGKYGLIIDFNRWVKGVDHLGLKKLTVNNNVQDPACTNQYLGYALFREAGVPASRSGFASVTFNGVQKGLYTLVESQDNDVFLEKHYGTDEGNLYEGEGSDLRGEGYQSFDQDNGKDQSKQDLQQLAAALDAIGPGQDSTAVLQQYFDLDEYVNYVATELYLGHWDGYAFGVNNYAIHHHPTTSKWTFLPWGIDQLFIDEIGHYGGVMMKPGPSWSDGHGGRVHQLGFQSPTCLKKLNQAFKDVLTRVDQMDLLGLAQKARALAEPYALSEAQAYGDPELTKERLDGIESRIQNGGTKITKWVVCLDGGSVDGDNDSYNACTVDCDDNNPHVHPGATEECNFHDDDCNDVLDDPPECPKCLDRMGPDGLQYSFCYLRKSWNGALQYCQQNGQQLASLHSEQSWEFVSFGMIETFGEELSWIGLSDQTTEGTFVWSDGSALDYEHWAEPGAPPSEEQDCVLNAPFGWWATECAEEHAFVCVGS